MSYVTRVYSFAAVSIFPWRFKAPFLEKILNIDCIIPKSHYTLNVRSRGKQVVLFSRESWCFPRRSGGKHQDYVERHVWTWVINRATSPSNSFCSILLLNNSHVFLLLKKQPLLHDFSSTVSCAFFALTFDSTEWKKLLFGFHYPYDLK